MKPTQRFVRTFAPGVLALSLNLAPTADGQALLIDFGASSTTSPDANGNYWNNFTAGGSTLSNMVTSSNATTSYGLGYTTGVSLNTFTGALVGPNPALGVFNFSTVYTDGANATSAATQSFNLTGLNSFQTYDFLLLGTRSATDTRTTTYTVTGSNSATGNSITSGTNAGGSGINYNVTPLALSGITPNGSSIISVSYTNPTAASFSYLNAMQVIGYVPYTDGATHTLSGAKSYPGNTILSHSTTVNSGAVGGALGSGTSALELGSGGGTLSLGTNETVTALIGTGNLALTTSANSLTINTGATTTFSVQTGATVTNDYAGILSGSGTLSKTGSGTQILSGANTFSGSVQTGAGTLTLNHVNALQNAKLDTLYTGTGTVAFGVAGSNTYNLGGLAGNKAIALGTNSLNVSTAAGATVYDGALGGSGSLTKSGANTLTLRGNNSFTGAVTISAGTLQISDDGPTGGGTIGSTSGITNNALLVYNLTVNDRTYANAIGGTGTLTKTGGKSLTLSGSNGYTGTTTVSGGKLAVNGSTNAASAFSVQTGGTLGGSGTIGGTVSVLSGGHFAPGNSISSTFATGALTLAGGSFTDIELGTAGTSHATPGTSDRTTVTGSLALGGTLTVLDNAAANGDGGIGAGSYKIFSQTGTPSGSFAAVVNVAGYHAKVDTATSGSVYLDNYALASAGTIAAKDLGKARVGGTFSNSGALSVTNATAANSGFSEGLNATQGTVSGGVIAGGSNVSNLAGASSSTSLTVGFSTATSGAKSGNTTINLASSGSNSGYADSSLGSQTVGITGNVYDYAQAVFSLAAGSAAGSLTPSGNDYILDFGTGLALNTTYTATLQLANGLLANAFQDQLRGSYSTTGDSRFSSTAGTFSDLLANTGNSFTVTFNTGSVGSFSGGLTLYGYSVQSGLTDAALAPVTLTIAGAAIPEPDVATLWGGLGVLALLGRRRQATKFPG